MAANGRDGEGDGKGGAEEGGADEWDLLSDLENTGSTPPLNPEALNRRRGQGGDADEKPALGAGPHPNLATPATQYPGERDAQRAGSLWDDDDLPPLPEDAGGDPYGMDPGADPADWQAPADWAPPPLTDPEPAAEARAPRPPAAGAEPPPSSFYDAPEDAPLPLREQARGVPKIVLLALPVVGFLALAILVYAFIAPSREEQLKDEAEERIAAGDIAGAARLMEQALAKEEDPRRELEERRRLRDLYGEKGSLREATDQAYLISQVEIATVDDLSVLASLYEQQSRYSEAARLYPRLASHPEAPPALRLGAARRLFELGAWDQSQTALKALASGELSRSAAALEVEALATLGRLGDAEARLRPALAAHPNDPDLLTAQAQIFLARGDLAGADGRLLAALAQDRTHRDALGQRLAILRHRREAQAGAETAERLEASHGDDAVAHFYLAQYYGGHSQPTRTQGERVAVHCKRLGEIDPASALLPLCETTAALAMGELGKAEAPATRALKAAPGIPLAWKQMIRLRLRQGDRASAGMVVGEALTAFPERLDLRVRRADLQAARGELEEAWETYLSVLKEVPEFIPALMGQGNVERSSGAFSQADKLYRRVLELDPFQLDARYGRADIFLARGNGAAAIQEYKAIAALSPDEYEALLRVAAVYAVDGEETLALAFIEQALKAGAPPGVMMEQPAFEALLGRPGFQDALRPYR